MPFLGRSRSKNLCIQSGKHLAYIRIGPYVGFQTLLHIWQRVVSEIRRVFKRNSALHQTAFLQNNPTKLQISIALIYVVRRHEISAFGTAFLLNNEVAISSLHLSDFIDITVEKGS